MNIYQKIQHEIEIQDNHPITEMSQEKYDEIVNDVTVELTKLANEFIALLKNETSEEAIFFERFFRSIILYLRNPDNFKDLMHIQCNNIDAGKDFGLCAVFCGSSRKYEQCEELIKLWKDMNDYGLYAVMSMRI